MSSDVTQAAATTGSAALAASAAQPASANTAAPAVPAAIPTEALNAHRADLSAAEYFDVLDERGHPTGVSKLRSLVHRDGDWHACVHIWVLHARSGMVLLQRRAACKDSFPSCWDVSCAGHLAAGETVAAAAEAELREELGLQAPDGVPFGEWCRPLCAPFPRTVVSQGGRFIDREHTHCFVVEGEWEAESMRLQEEEVERVEWTELADFAAALQQIREGYVAVPDLELYARMVFAPLEERIKLIRTKHAADVTVQHIRQSHSQQQGHSDERLPDHQAAYAQHLAQPADAGMASGNPFGSTGDGFAATPVEGRSATNSVFVAPAQTATSEQPAAAPVAQPVSASSSSSRALSDVPVASPPDRLAALAALPSFASPADELDGSANSKHGRIVVGDPELRPARFPMSSYHVYKVSSAAGAVEHVFRRYSDFVWLRNTLVSAFPGVFVPPLPEKKMLGSKDEHFVEGRRLDLQRWLQRLVVRSFLADHEAVALFLHRATASFDDEAKAITKATEHRPTHEIVSLYMDLFPELARLPANDSAGADVESIRDWLVVAEARMAALTGATEKLVSTNASGVQDLSRVSSMLHSNYAVEKEFVSSPPPSLVARGAIAPRVDIADSVAAWGLSLKWSNNAYDELLLGPLHYELQDIQAMSEAVKARGELAARHAKSVKTAAKWAAPGGAPKNEKQETARQTDDQTAKDESLLLDLVNKLILHAQFQQHWEWRVEQFRKRLHQFAKAQIEASKQLHDTFAQIAAATAGTD